MFNIENEQDSNIAKSIIAGKSNFEMSEEFGYSVGTIKMKLSEAFDKYGVNSREELAVVLTKINIMELIKSLQDKGFPNSQILLELKKNLKRDIEIHTDMLSKKRKKIQTIRRLGKQPLISEYSLKASAGAR
jgi:DNA-binding CsgD family transcriptional regulator